MAGEGGSVCDQYRWGEENRGQLPTRRTASMKVGKGIFCDCKLGKGSASRHSRAPHPRVEVLDHVGHVLPPSDPQMPLRMRVGRRRGWRQGCSQQEREMGEAIRREEKMQEDTLKAQQ